MRTLDDTLTTIAIPDQFHIDRFTETSGASQDEIITTIRETIYKSDLLERDSRRIFNAIADDINPVSLRVTGLGLDPRLAAYSARPIAALVVTCEKIDFNYYYMDYPDEETSEQIKYIYRTAYGSFRVEEALHLNEEYSKPRFLNIEFYANPDGSHPFELRQQYIVMGEYTQGGGFSGGFSSLTPTMPNIEMSDIVVDTVTTEEEFLKLFPYWSYWTPYGYNPEPDEILPLEIRELSYKQKAEPGEEYSIIKLTGDLEEVLASPELAWMNEAMEAAEISSRSFQVLTTNDPLSFLRLNQRRNLFDEGRTFTVNEIRDGERVCLVSRSFADTNDLSFGDTIPLEMYSAVIGTTIISYTPSENANLITQSIWVPSLYNQSLEIREPIEYTIVGIMNITPSDFSDHAISRSMVIIPDKSFGATVGEPVSKLPVADFVPLLQEGIIVPNGKIDETRATINSIAPGYGSLFRFYDQGYGSVRAALSNLQFGLSWILGLAAAVWIAIAYLFSFFFTARKRKEAMILNSIGTSRASRFFWVFIQGSIPVVLSLGISLAISLPFYEYIIDAAAEITEAFTDSFRDLTLSDAADSGIRRRVPLDSSPISLIISATAGTVLLLVITGLMSARTVIFKTLSSGKGEN